MRKMLFINLNVIVLGIVFGYLCSHYWVNSYSHEELYLSNTHVVIDKPSVSLYLSPIYELEFKYDNKFEYSWFTDKLGVIASGSYYKEGAYIFFSQEYHESITKEGEKTNYIEEVMISKGRGLSDDKVLFYKLNENSFILFSSELSLYFKI